MKEDTKGHQKMNSSIEQTNGSRLPPPKCSSSSCVIYWEDPKEMLNPSLINPFFLDIVVTHTLTLLLGLMGNLLVVTVMITERKSRSATNLFLASLSVADLLLLAVCAPLETLHYFLLQWDKNAAVCRLSKYLELLSAVASVLNLAAVTLERFVVIVFPLRSRSLCTISNCRRVIVVVWVLAAALTAPIMFTKGTYEVTYTNHVTSVTIYYCNDTENGVVFAAYQVLVLFGVPGILMIVCYTCVIIELWRSTRSMLQLTNTTTVNKRRGQNSNHDWSEDCLNNEKIGVSKEDMCCRWLKQSVPRRSKKKEDARKARKQVIKMLILVVILFLVCWGPRIIMELLIKLGLDQYDKTNYTLRVAFNILPYIHACINPFIYSFMSKNFRRSLQRSRCFRKLPFKTALGRHTTNLHSSLHYTCSGSKKPPYRGASTSSASNYHMEPSKCTELETVLGGVPSTIV